MNATTTGTDPVGNYLAALAVTGQMEAPYGAVVFTMLTTLSPLPALLNPTTVTSRGRLTLAANPRLPGATSGKEIPLPGHTLDVLGRARADEAVSWCLGIQPHALPGFRQNLQLHLLDHGGVDGLGTPELAWASSVHAVMAAATTPEARTAVLHYAGIRVPGAEATKQRLRPAAESGLDQIANLIDELVIDAGFGRATALIAV